jgi:hypothetical protein
MKKSTFLALRKLATPKLPRLALLLKAPPKADSEATEAEGSMIII